MLEVLASFQNIALLASRFFLGLLFMIHGNPKFFGSNPGIVGFGKWLYKEGVPLPFMGAFIAALTEFVGGALLILGLFTRIVAILMALVIIVAAIVNIKNGKEFKGGWELDVVILGLCLIFITFGAGEISLDFLLDV